MPAYWLTYTDGSQKCVEAPGQYEALRAAEEKLEGKIATIEPLPYPAEPRAITMEYPPHGVCPSFCYSPNKCAGSSTCPKAPSCVE